MATFRSTTMPLRVTEQINIARAHPQLVHLSAVSIAVKVGHLVRHNIPRLSLFENGHSAHGVGHTVLRLPGCRLNARGEPCNAPCVRATINAPFTCRRRTTRTMRATSSTSTTSSWHTLRARSRARCVLSLQLLHFTTGLLVLVRQAAWQARSTR